MTEKNGIIAIVIPLEEGVQMARNFTEVKRSKSLHELNSFCKEVAEEYAWTADTIGCLMEKYNLTKSGANKVIAHAVVYCLVDDKTVSKMADKASENQSGHSSGRSSRRNYEKLRRERKKESIKFVKELMATVISTDDFMEFHGITRSGYNQLSKILWEALTLSEEFSVDAVQQVLLKLLTREMTAHELQGLLKLFDAILQERAKSHLVNYYPY